jgi:hypothetical protein
VLAGSAGVPEVGQCGQAKERASASRRAVLAPKTQGGFHACAKRDSDIPAPGRLFVNVDFVYEVSTRGVGQVKYLDGQEVRRPMRIWNSWKEKRNVR